MSEEENNAPQGVTTEQAVESAQESAENNSTIEQGSEEQSNNTEQTTTEPAASKTNKKPWFLNTIENLREDRRIIAAERDIYKKQLEQRAGNAEGQESSATAVTEADIERIAEQRVSQRTAVKAFNDKCDATANLGKEKYSDFGEALGVLGQVGLVDPQFLDIATDLEHGHEVLYHLGKNPDEAAKLLNMPPHKQAIQLAKIEAKIASKPAKQPSKAPAPITPLGGGSSSGYTGNDPSKMSDEQYMEWRKTWKNG